MTQSFWAFHSCLFFCSAKLFKYDNFILSVNNLYFLLPSLCLLTWFVAFIMCFSYTYCPYYSTQQTLFLFIDSISALIIYCVTDEQIQQFTTHTYPLASVGQASNNHLAGSSASESLMRLQTRYRPWLGSAEQESTSRLSHMVVGTFHSF